MNERTDRRLQIAVVSLAVAVVGLASGWASHLIQDRQDVAVSLRVLSENDNRVAEDLSDIKRTLTKLADQNAMLLVLQEQVGANRAAISELGAKVEKYRDETRGTR